MKVLLFLICVIFLLIIIFLFKINSLKNIEYRKPEILSNKKILTVYYSNGGNTKSVGEKLHSIVGGDLKEIELLEQYPKNVFTMSKFVRQQIKEDYLPQIKEIDISNYDIIFVGSPIWNFSVSQPVKAFLKNNNFENKTLIPFFTFSGGANKAKVIKDLNDFTKINEKTIPLFMIENGIFLTKEQIVKWLNSFN